MHLLTKRVLIFAPHFAILTFLSELSLINLVSYRGNDFTGPHDHDELLFFHEFHEPDSEGHQFGLKRREPHFKFSCLYPTVICDYDNHKQCNGIAAFCSSCKAAICKNDTFT